MARLSAPAAASIQSELFSVCRLKDSPLASTRTHRSVGPLTSSPSPHSPHPHRITHLLDMSRVYSNATPLRPLVQNSATPTSIVQRECREARAAANKLNKQIADEKAKNDDLHDQIEVLRREMGEKNREIKLQKETITALRNENYNSVEKHVYETLKQDNEHLNQELSRLKSHVTSLEEMQKENGNEVQSFRADLATLTSELEKRTAELESVKAERDFFVGECRRFQDRVKVSEQLREEDLKTLREVYEEKIQLQQERIDELMHNELSMSMSGEHIIMSEPDFLPPESLNVVNEIMYNELVDNVESLKGQYEEQIKELQATISQKDELMQQQTGRIFSLESDLTSSVKTVNQLSQELQQLAQTHEDRISEHLNFVSEKDDAIQKLNEKLQAQDSLLLTLRKEQDDQSAVIAEKSALISDQENVISDLSDTVSRKDEQIRDLSSKSEHQDQQIHKLIEKLSQQTSQLQASRKELDDISKNLEEKIALIRDQEIRLTEFSDVVSSRDEQIRAQEERITRQDLLAEEYRSELKALSSDLQTKIDAGDAKFDGLLTQVTKQLADCKDNHQSELMRLVAEAKSAGTRLSSKQEAELKDMWNLVIEKDTAIAKLNEKVKSLESSSQSSQADLRSFSAKMEEMSRSRNDQIGRLEEEIREQRRSCSELHFSEIQRLNDDLKRFNEMLTKKEKETQQLRDELQITEQSFAMERAQKKRYQRECCDLEKQLNSLKSSNTGNNTYIMPTINFQSGASGQDVAAATALVHSLSQSHAANSTFDAGKTGRRPLPGTSFFVADEPSEVMNSSFLSTTEDAFERFSTLQERNRQQPPHLKSCYAAEHQEVAIPENEIRGIPNRQILAAMSQAGHNQTFSITDTTTHTRTFHVGGAPITSQPVRKPFSPGARSVFRRMKGSWSPSLKKSFTEIPS